MPRKPGEDTKRVLSILGCSDNLRQRVKLEALRQCRSQSEIILDILNDNLPLFEQFLDTKMSKTTPKIPTELNGGVAIQTTLLTR